MFLIFSGLKFCTKSVMLYSKMERRFIMGESTAKKKKYCLYQVDAFTRERFLGNPAGVVTNADGLDEEQMKKIAREFNNSETAFIFEGNGDEYDVQVRFFTPVKEVPICGHATIAAHYVRAVEEGRTKRGVIRQKTGIGIIPVEVLPTDENQYQILMTQGDFSIKELPGEAYKHEITAALGLMEEELREDCPMVIASTGHGKVMIGIKDREVLDGLSPDMERLCELSNQIGCNGYYVFTLSPDEEILVHGRMFGPAVGVREDPVTGNANGPLGGYLVHYGLIGAEENQVSFRIAQGEAMGRPGTMDVIVDLADGKPEQIRIVGEAVIVFETEMELPQKV